MYKYAHLLSIYINYMYIFVTHKDDIFFSTELSYISTVIYEDLPFLLTGIRTAITGFEWRESKKNLQGRRRRMFPLNLEPRE